MDEFQDTDPIQAEVILLLAGAPSAERDWTRVPLRPGALFVVGDPKQSIYRFRRADIDIYQRVRQRIEATGGQVATLTACFRSVPALCEWANTRLRRAVPRRAHAASAGLRRRSRPARDEKGAALGVRAIEIPETVSGGDAVAAFDAAAIARFIRARGGRAGRRKPGDFLILTRTRRALPIYTRALEALRLPVEVSGGAAFAQSSAVTGLADLLRALADPDDGPAVVGVLRGPLFGVSDPELFRHRQAGGGFLVTAPDLAETARPGRRGAARAAHDVRVDPQAAGAGARSSASWRPPAAWPRPPRAAPAGPRRAICCTPWTASARSPRTAARWPTRRRR